jgi:uncharacterized membrane protein
MEWTEFLLRWIHFLAGITWIGMLYYFNLVQTPFFATELGGTAKSAMVRGQLPNALWWFRWGAMFTFLSGLVILLMKLGHGGMSLSSGYMTRILTGALFGTLMFANVWLVIWPNQRAVIENANRVAGGGAADPAAAGKGAQAGMASRTNALFSVPMLFFMAAGTHLPSITGEGGVGLYWILVLAIAAGLEWNGVFQKPGSSSQKMLTTVSGTIHAGLATAVVVAVLHLVVI